MKTMFKKAVEEKDVHLALALQKLGTINKNIRLSMYELASLFATIDQPYRKQYCSEGQRISKELSAIIERFAKDYSDTSKRLPIGEKSVTLVDVNTFDSKIVDANPVNDSCGVVFFKSKEEGC